MTKESDIAILEDSGADVTFLGNMVEIQGYLTSKQIEAVQRLLQDHKNYEIEPISGRAPSEPREVIHTVGIGYCDNCDCEHCSKIRSPENRGESQ